jgi:hypothetical protein
MKAVVFLNFRVFVQSVLFSNIKVSIGRTLLNLAKLIVRAKECIHSSILRDDFQVKHFVFKNIQSNIKYFIFYTQGR